MGNQKMQENGFTLLEVLIAITIGGLIISTTFFFLQQGLSTWERAVKGNGQDQHLRVLEAKLQGDLHNLFFVEFYPEYEFAGDYQGLILLVKKEEQLYRVNYWIDYYNQQLVRKVETIVAGKKGQEKLLVEPAELRFFNKLDLYRVDFSFYDPQRKYWSNYWSYQESGYLPQLVKLTISTPEGEIPAISSEVYPGRQY